MIGDPYLKLGEIGISAEVARNLLVTESVNSYNIGKLCAVFRFHNRIYSGTTGWEVNHLEEN